MRGARERWWSRSDWPERLATVSARPALETAELTQLPQPHAVPAGRSPAPAAADYN